MDERDYVVRDSPKGRRYELLLDGERVGEILYSLRPDKIVLLTRRSTQHWRAPV